MSPASAEYGATKGYLNWLLNLPWGKTTPEDYTISEAEKILKRLALLEPTNYRHCFNLGLIYGSTERWDQAITYYRKALDLCRDPEWLDPYPLMGYIYSMRNQAEKAEECFRLYLAKHPDSPKTRMKLGNHYLRIRKFKEAVEQFERCLELVWEKVGPMWRLAMTYRTMGNQVLADKWLTLFRLVEEENQERTEAENLKKGVAPSRGLHVPSPYSGHRGKKLGSPEKPGDSKKK